MCWMAEAAGNILRGKGWSDCNFFGAGEGDAGVCCSAGLGGSPFDRKISWGGKVAVGENICVLGYL